MQLLFYDKSLYSSRKFVLFIKTPYRQMHNPQKLQAGSKYQYQFDAIAQIFYTTPFDFSPSVFPMPSIVFLCSLSDFLVSSRRQLFAVLSHAHAQKELPKKGVLNTLPRLYGKTKIMVGTDKKSFKFTEANPNSHQFGTKCSWPTLNWSLSRIH